MPRRTKIDYISADLHKGHSNILKFQEKTRPFATIEEHDNFIRNEINKKCSPDDTLYILGDVAFGNITDAIRWLKSLVPKLFLVAGNHDQKFLMTEEFRNCFVKVCDYHEIKIDKTLVCMSHYPFEEWNKSHRGSIMLHGHCHGRPEGKERKMDVGLDTNDCRIYTVNEVFARQIKKPFMVPHHRDV